MVLLCWLATAWEATIAWPQRHASLSLSSEYQQLQLISALSPVDTHMYREVDEHICIVREMQGTSGRYAVLRKTGLSDVAYNAWCTLQY